MKMNPNATNENMVNLFSSLLDELAERFNMDILFVPHVTGPAESKDDRRIHIEVQSKMKAKAHVIANEYTPAELKGMIGLCVAMLGARMHANIGALSNGIPTIAIAYSHKTPGIMEILHQDGLVLDITSLTRSQIMDKFAYLDAHREEIIQSLEEALIPVKKLSQSNVDMIKDYLSKA
jgi:colanic acid/amylovoran biosynthesis protein